MTKEENNALKKQKKAGRPKGAKSKLNLPIRNIADAVEWTKKINNEAKGDEFHPENLVDYLGIGKGFVSPALSVLQKFGFIEKGSFGWKISELGTNAINNDRESIKEALERVDLYRDLLKNFGDRSVTKMIILNYLKAKYKKGENTEIIADKYAEAVDYLNSSLKGTTPQTIGKNVPIENIKELDKKIIVLLKLKYLFFPEEKSKSETIEELIDEFKDEVDPTIKSVISQIDQKKSDDNTLKILVNILFDSFKDKYPDLKYKKLDNKSKKDKPQEIHNQSD